MGINKFCILGVGYNVMPEAWEALSGAINTIQAAEPRSVVLIQAEHPMVKTHGKSMGVTIRSVLAVHIGDMRHHTSIMHRR